MKKFVVFQIVLFCFLEFGKAAMSFNEFWLTVWCNLGGIFNFKDFACGTPPTPDTFYIPAT